MAVIDYQLIDFGGGRKLERFGPLTIDRPSPAADGSQMRSPQLWANAAIRYERNKMQGGCWKSQKANPDVWRLDCGAFQLELKRTRAGQLGVFPEQAENWSWIAERAKHAGRPKVLNLFGYTGASTLAAAAAGAEVVHVDAAANVVDWARRNATLSSLGNASIRWIVEDAMTFSEREVRRGNRYDAVLLDPPAYGHGPKGQAWKLAEHLPRLLGLCWELCAEGRFMLLSCHSGELAQSRMLLEYAQNLQPEGVGSWHVEAAAMNLLSSSGAILNCGAAVRWTSPEPKSSDDQ